jgi:hypothetical protein
LKEQLAVRPPEEPPFVAVRGALDALAGLYTDEPERVLAAKRLSHETPAIRARLLDKHARWENALTQGLAARLRVDPERDPRPRLIAAVALAAFSTAFTEWCSSDGRKDLHELADDCLEAVGHGFDPRSDEA